MMVNGGESVLKNANYRFRKDENILRMQRFSVYSSFFFCAKQTIMLLCSNNSNALILPMVEGILYDISSFRYIYLCIFTSLALIGLISNLFSLITFMRDRIRFTIYGVYLIILAICGLVSMLSFLTNIIISLRYDNYSLRLWACHGYPFVFLIMINMGILMSAAVVLETILNRYFGFDRFRSRKCAIFTSIILLIFVSISNLDKILARRLISDQTGHLYCTYNSHSSSFWFYINNATSCVCMIIPCLIHFISVVFILSQIRQQKQKWYRKLIAYQDLLLPSFLILLSSCPYIIFRFLFGGCITYSSRFFIRLHIGLILVLYIPQIFTFMIYVLPNRYYRKEFQQSWICRLVCCCSMEQRQIEKFEVMHRSWQRRSPLETVMTISNFNDICFDSEFYNKIKLEV